MSDLDDEADERRAAVLKNQRDNINAELAVLDVAVEP